MALEIPKYEISLNILLIKLTNYFDVLYFISCLLKIQCMYIFFHRESETGFWESKTQ